VAAQFYFAEGKSFNRKDILMTSISLGNQLVFSPAVEPLSPGDSQMQRDATLPQSTQNTPAGTARHSANLAAASAISRATVSIKSISRDPRTNSNTTYTANYLVNDKVSEVSSLIPDLRGIAWKPASDKHSVKKRAAPEIMETGNRTDEDFRKKLEKYILEPGHGGLKAIDGEDDPADSAIIIPQEIQTLLRLLIRLDQPSGGRHRKLYENSVRHQVLTLSNSSHKENLVQIGRERLSSTSIEWKMIVKAVNEGDYRAALDNLASQLEDYYVSFVSDKSPDNFVEIDLIPDQEENRSRIGESGVPDDVEKEFHNAKNLPQAILNSSSETKAGLAPLENSEGKQIFTEQMSAVAGSPEMETLANKRLDFDPTGEQVLERINKINPSTNSITTDTDYDEVQLGHFYDMTSDVVSGIPDLTDITRTLAKEKLRERTGEDLDVDNVWLHEFSNAESAEKAYSKQEHEGPPRDSQTVLEAWIAGSQPRWLSLDSDDLNKMLGIYNVGFGATHYGPENEIKYTSSELVDDLAGNSLQERVDGALDSFWKEHHGDWRATAKGGFIGQARKAFMDGTLTRPEYELVMKGAAPDVGLDARITVNQLRGNAEPDASVRVGRIAINDHVSSDIRLFTGKDGWQVIYLPGEENPFHPCKDVKRWIIERAQDLKTCEMLKKHFSLHDREKDLPDGLDEMLGKLASKQWDESKIDVKSAEQIPADVFNDLAEQTKIRVAGDVKRIIDSHGKVRIEMWGNNDLRLANPIPGLGALLAGPTGGLKPLADTKQNAHKNVKADKATALLFGGIRGTPVFQQNSFDRTVEHVLETLNKTYQPILSPADFVDDYIRSGILKFEQKTGQTTGLRPDSPIPVTLYPVALAGMNLDGPNGPVSKIISFPLIDIITGQYRYDVENMRDPQRRRYDVESMKHGRLISYLTQENLQTRMEKAQRDYQSNLEHVNDLKNYYNGIINLRCIEYLSDRKNSPGNDHVRAVERFLTGHQQAFEAEFDGNTLNGVFVIPSRNGGVLFSVDDGKYFGFSYETIKNSYPIVPPEYTVLKLPETDEFKGWVLEKLPVREAYDYRTGGKKFSNSKIGRQTLLSNPRRPDPIVSSRFNFKKTNGRDELVDRLFDGLMGRLRSDIDSMVFTNGEQITLRMLEIAKTLLTLGSVGLGIASGGTGTVLARIVKFGASLILGSLVFGANVAQAKISDRNDQARAYEEAAIRAGVFSLIGAAAGGLPLASQTMKAVYSPNNIRRAIDLRHQVKTLSSKAMSRLLSRQTGSANVQGNPPKQPGNGQIRYVTDPLESSHSVNSKFLHTTVHRP
jgi:hypothetical protein